MEERSPRHEPLFEDDLPYFPPAQPSRLFDFVFGDDSEQPGTDWDALFAQDSQQEPTAVPIQTTQIDSSAAQLSWEDQETQVDPVQPAQSQLSWEDQETQADSEQSAAPQRIFVHPYDPTLPPVTITTELLHSIAHLNANQAAQQVGLTRHQFVIACSRLGVPSWNIYRTQAVSKEVREARSRQERFQHIHSNMHENVASNVTLEKLESVANLNNFDAATFFNLKLQDFHGKIREFGINSWCNWRYKVLARNNTSQQVEATRNVSTQPYESHASGDNTIIDKPAANQGQKRSFEAMSQEDLEFLRTLEEDCPTTDSAVNWATGICESAIQTMQQPSQTDSAQLTASVDAVENAFAAFPVKSSTAGNEIIARTKSKTKNGTADSYSEWCVCMSYYMSKYGGHHHKTITKVTGMHNCRLSVLMNESDDENYTEYKTKFKTMNKSELRNYILTLEVKKHVPLKVTVLTFFDIATVWNYHLQGMTTVAISEITQIARSTVSAIIKRSRHNKITNYFPLDRLLDLQWFKRNWQENAEKLILSSNVVLKTKYIQSFLTSHPEFKAVYDERQKVNFAMSPYQIYHIVAREDHSARPLFPTLPYPSDWVHPCCQILNQKGSIDDDESDMVEHVDYMQYLMDDTQSNLTMSDFLKLSSKRDLANKLSMRLQKDYPPILAHGLQIQSGETLEDSRLTTLQPVEDPEQPVVQSGIDSELPTLPPSEITEDSGMAMDEQGCTPNEHVNHLTKKRKRSLNKYKKQYDKYTICYAYYLSVFSKLPASEVSSKTGIYYKSVYYIKSNSSLLYSDYIDEIKDMSKEELEQFLRELQNPQ